MEVENLFTQLVVLAQQAKSTSQIDKKMRLARESKTVILQIERLLERNMMHNSQSDSSDRPNGSFSSSLGSSSEPLHLIDIARLKPSLTKFGISGVCVSKSEIQKWGGKHSKMQGQLFHVIIRDHSGDVRCTAFNSEVMEYYGLFEVGKSYRIANGKLRSGQASPVEMTLTLSTVIEPEVSKTNLKEHSPAVKIAHPRVAELTRSRSISGSSDSLDYSSPPLFEPEQNSESEDDSEYYPSHYTTPTPTTSHGRLGQYALRASIESTGSTLSDSTEAALSVDVSHFFKSRDARSQENIK